MKRMYTGLALCVVVLMLAACVPVPAEDLAGATASVTTIRQLKVDHDASVGGALTVTGATTVGGNLNVTGTATITGGYSTGASTVWEGATADDYETTLAITDPTADRTITAPNASGTLMLSSLATNAPDAANSVTGASNALLFEGATANAYEMSLSPADPGADVTLTLPAETAALMVSSLTTNATDAANAVTGASNALVFEGATANAYETTVTPTDPTADNTITLPNMTGTVLVGSAANKVVFGSSVVTGTATLTHGLTTPLYALCTMGTDPADNEEDRCTVTISGATVTAKVWKEAASPTAGDSGVTVYWIVAGTP